MQSGKSSHNNYCTASDLLQNHCNDFDTSKVPKGNQSSSAPNFDSRVPYLLLNTWMGFLGNKTLTGSKKD